MSCKLNRNPEGNLPITGMELNEQSNGNLL